VLVATLVAVESGCSTVSNSVHGKRLTDGCGVEVFHKLGKVADRGRWDYLSLLEVGRTKVVTVAEYRASDGNGDASVLRLEVEQVGVLEVHFIEAEKLYRDGNGAGALGDGSDGGVGFVHRRSAANTKEGKQTPE